MLFDVGNSRLKWGVYEVDRLVRFGSIDHDKMKTRGMTALTNRLPTGIDYALACNVAGAAFATRLAGVIGIHCGTDLHFARAEKDAFGVRNGYRQPRRLGVDRWVALIAARAETRAAVCVVDAGTAVTIDAMDNTGQHLGGQILPGLGLMRDALQGRTSGIRLPQGRARDLDPATAPFAGNTRDAVQSGAMSAVCGAIEHTIRAMRGEGLRPRLILTGGDASRILKRLDGTILHRPHLVLQGLAHMVHSKA